MAILPIHVSPDPILEKKAKKITDPSAREIQELILDMVETMEANNGVGLAAPQVGKSLRLCIVRVDRKTYILINPVFKSKSWKKVVAEEGCLSFPGVQLLIKRSSKVVVEAVDRTGKKYEVVGEGLLGRALQHEIDHLDGVLFVTRKAKFKKIIEGKNTK
jgi:peptide deformylase